MDVDNTVFVQQFRTSSSEIWLAETDRTKDGEAFAQLDIHYGSDNVAVTVIYLTTPKTQDEVHRLLDLVDDELLSMGDLEKGNVQFRVIYGGSNKSAVLKRETAVTTNPLGGLL